MKYIICGIPRSGKTTFAYKLSELVGLPVLSTDALIEHREWSARLPEVMQWITAPTDSVVEGVQAAHALRACLQNGTKPDALIIYLDTPMLELTPQQAAMAKGIVKVMADVRSLIGPGRIIGRARANLLLLNEQGPLKN